MLPSLQRLRSSDVERVLGRGFSFGAGSVRGKALRAEGKESSRFAVVVSKKVAGSAVMRNRLRRWAFESIPLSPLPSAPHDVVLMISKKYDSFEVVCRDVAETLGRLVNVRTRA